MMNFMHSKKGKRIASIIIILVVLAMLLSPILSSIA